jgi:hypothetical protein
MHRPRLFLPPVPAVLLAPARGSEAADDTDGDGAFDPAADQSVPGPDDDDDDDQVDDDAGYRVG